MSNKSARALWAAKLAGQETENGGGSTGKTPAARRGQAAVDAALSRGRGKPFAGMVLGIDPSLRGTGLAIVEIAPGAEPLLRESRTLRAPAQHDMPACLAMIFRGISELLERHDARHVAVEQTIYVQNTRTAQILGAARGAAITAAALQELPVFEYPPLRIKQAVTGFGRASKEQMIRQAQSLFHLREPIPSDEADAACTALCHAYTWREEG